MEKIGSIINVLYIVNVAQSITIPLEFGKNALLKQPNGDPFNDAPGFAALFLLA